MAEEKLTMFGKTYNTVGSADSNLIIQTRGDIKIRWGNKFIDLIKNGKINAEVDTLQKVKSKDNIHTDGIYMTNNGETDEIWVMIDGNLINLVGEINNTYVSYKGVLEVSIDEKFMALNNIGLYYNTQEDLINSGILNGVAFVILSGKFFTVLNGEIKEYSINTIVPDPLILHNITIDGNKESIYSTSKLDFGISNNLIMTVSTELLTTHKDIITRSPISSDNYTGNKGYSIYIDKSNEQAIAIFDKIIIRDSIVYEGEEEIAYEDLLMKIQNRELVIGKKYIITDFLDIRDVTFPNETYKKDIIDSSYHKKNVYPIVLKAKTDKELEPTGYFQDNPEWTIEYDPLYHNIVKYQNTSEGGYTLAYSKGRITKLTDEFGNVANFDFKHTTFDNRYTFNIANPRIVELNALLTITSDSDAIASLNAELAATNLYADATLDINVIVTNYTNDNGLAAVSFERKRNERIKNNTIYLKEPKLIDSSIVSGEKEIKYDDYIIFWDCGELIPYNNTIKEVTGKFKVTKDFYENNLKAIQYEDDSTIYNFNFVFTGNTATGTIYFKEKIETNDAFVIFTIDKFYENNTFGEVHNSKFTEGLKNNVFNNMRNVSIDKLIEGNVFEKGLLDIHIKCPQMKNNIFKDEINTYENKDLYYMHGILVNNVFKGKLECVTFELTCDIQNSEFEDIKYKDGTYTVFSGIIDKSQFGSILGCNFKDTSNIYNTIYYNNDLYINSKLILVTVDKVIRNSSFRDDIIKVHFYDDIDKVICNGTFGNNTSESLIGKIEYSEFYGDVVKLFCRNTLMTYCEFNYIQDLTIDASAHLENCKFNGTINSCTIEGTLNNCLFEGLSDGIQIKGPLIGVIIQVDMTPSTVGYVEHATNLTYLTNNPFIISQLAVPKLQISGKKICYIEDRTNNGSTIRVFVVKTANEDYSPAGIIVMFNGLATNIPDGWAICDGTKGTPDLRGRFIRMIDAGESTGPVNNKDLVTNGAGTRRAYLNGSHVPAHSHNFKTYSDNIIVTPSLSASYNGSVSHTLSVNISRLTVTVDESSVNIDSYYSNGTSTGKYLADEGSSSVYTKSDEYDHKHTASIGGSATINGGITLPSISISGDISIPINFTPEQDTDSLPTVVNVEPLAYALIFIMKL